MSSSIGTRPPVVKSIGTPIVSCYPGEGHPPGDAVRREPVTGGRGDSRQRGAVPGGVLRDATTIGNPVRGGDTAGSAVAFCRTRALNSARLPRKRPGSSSVRVIQQPRPHRGRRPHPPAGSSRGPRADLPAGAGGGTPAGVVGRSSVPSSRELNRKRQAMMTSCSSTASFTST